MFKSVRRAVRKVSRPFERALGSITEPLTGRRATKSAERALRREVEAAEEADRQARESERRRREATLRAALQPDVSLFGVLGGSQDQAGGPRRTLG